MIANADGIKHQQNQFSQEQHKDQNSKQNMGVQDQCEKQLRGLNHKSPAQQTTRDNNSRINDILKRRRISGVFTKEAGNRSSSIVLNTKMIDNSLRQTRPQI